MAVVLKQIMQGSVTAGNNSSSAAPGEGKVQLIKDIRLVNKHATAAAPVSLAVVTGGGDRLISPQNLSLAPNQVYHDEGEFVLKASDTLKLTVGATGGPVDWLVSGLERDQS
jgi:hypothetical protein